MMMMMIDVLRPLVHMVYIYIYIYKLMHTVVDLWFGGQMDDD